eukprot:scaffold391914_cov16-Prasinocladus_malaysianus.AAC.1
MLCSHVWHPLQGFDLAKNALLEYIDSVKIKVDPNDRETLFCVAKASLRTKLSQALADQLTDIVTDAVLTIKRPEEPLDLHMVRAALARSLTNLRSIPGSSM